jgi:hypothetical protein
VKYVKSVKVKNTNTWRLFYRVVLWWSLGGGWPAHKEQKPLRIEQRGKSLVLLCTCCNLPFARLRGAGPSKLEKERSGGLAAKIEDKLHLTVESVTPEVIQKATLSQRGVFIGILTDKLRLLLGDEVAPAPASGWPTRESCPVFRLIVQNVDFGE